MTHARWFLKSHRLLGKNNLGSKIQGRQPQKARPECCGQQEVREAVGPRMDDSRHESLLCMC